MIWIENLYKNEITGISKKPYEKMIFLIYLNFKIMILRKFT